LEALELEINNIIKLASTFALSSGLIIFFTSRWLSSTFGFFEEVAGK